VNSIPAVPLLFRAGAAGGDRSRLFINDQLGVNPGAERAEKNQRFAGSQAGFLGDFGPRKAESLIISRAVEIGGERMDSKSQIQDSK
jgi:hypothetical protein